MAWFEFGCISRVPKGGEEQKNVIAWVVNLFISGEKVMNNWEREIVKRDGAIKNRDRK